MSGVKGRVLFAGQAYYNAWYLSRALRTRGWQADVLNWDADPVSQKFYHGEDFKFSYSTDQDRKQQVEFYRLALESYDIFHFSNTRCMTFGPVVKEFVEAHVPGQTEITLLKTLGKKIVYSHNGCHDGVTQTSFRAWKPEPVCDICRWRDVPAVCSDELSITWGTFRNSMADYQCILGGNRADFNVDPRIHEVPEFYCLDPEFWRPDLPVPEKFRLSYPPGTVKLYYAVGNYEARTDASGKNIKCTHIYLPLIERLKNEGHPVELIFAKDIPNMEVRFYQAQADIVIDMLTFGFFGANVREAMMLGKPAICFLRQEWLDSMREQIPEYVDELPVINATPSSIYDVLKDLIQSPRKREEIGKRARAFALKWHSSQAGARVFDQIYSSLLVQ